MEANYPMTRSLEDIQDGILDTLHAGEPMDREALLAEHAEHRDALVAFFEVVDLMEAPPETEEALPARLGEFRIIREIGRGGMGVVYEAEQPSLKRAVALKVLPPKLRADRGLHARFKREAEAAARLRHPNLVPVFSCGESAGAPFFAMELVDGTSLEHVIRERRDGRSESWPETGEASWHRALGICIKIADALQYAHGQGILHRDVKPANILLELDGTPRLTDFGLALDLEASSLTVAGEVFGSPQYMSPEQAFRRESPLDARTDIYSLAVTLYELLTLELPYGGRTQTDILSALSTGDLVPLCEADGALPNALERVLSRALEHEADERYADAAEFASDLRIVLDSGGRDHGLASKRMHTRSWLSGRVAAILHLDPPSNWRKRGGRIWTGRRIVGVFAASLLIAAAFIWLRYQAIQARSLAAVSREALMAAAVAQSDQSVQLIEDWIEPVIRMRGVIARNNGAACDLGIKMKIPDLKETLSVVPMWERSLNGGDWQPVHEDLPIYDLIGEGSVTQSVGHDLLKDMGEERDARTVSIQFRLRARLFRRSGILTDAKTISFAEAEELQDGTISEWNWPARTVFVYDEYPEDYPELIADQEFDEVMRLATIPCTLKLQSIGDRWMTIGLGYEADQNFRPLPSAFELEIRDRDTREVIATADISHSDSPAPDPNDRRTRTSYTVFNMQDQPTEAEARFLLSARAGDMEDVLLVFRASRKVALGQPDFDRYWDAEFEAVVPFEVERSVK